MQDKNERKLERTELNQTINIIDTINGGTFGELVNVTVEGLMIMTDREIPIQSIFQLALELPMEIAGNSTVELGADCLWCKKVENFNRYWAGFHIIDASDTATKQLNELIKLYAK